MRMADMAGTPEEQEMKAAMKELTDWAGRTCFDAAGPILMLVGLGMALLPLLAVVALILLALWLIDRTRRKNIKK